MKILSILLRLVAIAGAAFAVYTWMDTKGKTTESLGHMQGVEGATLQDKTAKVPDILKVKAKAESDLRKTSQSLKETEASLEKTKRELSDAGDMITDNQREIGEKNVKIKDLNSKVSGLESTVAKNDSEIKDLEAEIVKIKSETEPLIADLKSQIVDLEGAIANKDEEIASALATAEADYFAKTEELKAQLQTQTVETVIDPETGVEVVVKAAYIPEGEIITIVNIDEDSQLFVVNKGTNSGFEADSKVLIKKEDKLIANFLLVAVDADMSVCAVVNKDKGIPESILVGDEYEMLPYIPEVAEVAELPGESFDFSDSSATEDYTAPAMEEVAPAVEESNSTADDEYVDPFGS